MKRVFVSIAVTALAATAMVASSLPVLAHGGLSIEKDKCILRVGTHAVHFTGYQPQETGTQEFCEDIPNTGRIIVAMDYVDPGMRSVPVEVKILHVVDGKLSDQEQPVEFSLAPSAYPTGTIHFEHEFVEAGQYVGLVTAREGGVEQVGRFPFAVGKAWPPLVATGVKILAVMALAIGLAVTLVRRPWASASRRTRA